MSAEQRTVARGLSNFATDADVKNIYNRLLIDFDDVQTS